MKEKEVRLIDANACSSKLNGLGYDFGESGDYDFGGGLLYAAKIVEEQPTVDPESLRPHGKWEQCFEDWRKQIEGNKCSVCGFEHYGTAINHYCYCPNCGAKNGGINMEKEMRLIDANALKEIINNCSGTFTDDGLMVKLKDVLHELDCTPTIELENQIPVKKYEPVMCDGLTKVERHKNICEELNALYARKNHDYGDSFHITFVEEGMAMARIRLGDKFNRFKTLSRSDDRKVSDESIKDTLFDLANYAIMTILELEG